MKCEDFLSKYDLMVDAAAGRTTLPEEIAAALREHAAACASCRAESAFAAPLGRALRDLPVLGPSRPIDLEAIKRGSRSPLWVAPLAAAAAALVAVLALRNPMPPRTPPAEVIAGARTVAHVVDERTIALNRGWAAIKNRGGATLIVETPYAVLTSHGAEFLVAVDDVVAPDQSPVVEDIAMNPTLRTAAIAAGVSLIVTYGTVTVTNALGEKETNALEVAHVPAGQAPEVVALNESLEKVRRSLAGFERDMRAIQTGFEQRTAGFEGRVTALETKAVMTASAPTEKVESGDKIGGDITKARARFKEVAEKMNPLTFMADPEFKKLAEAMKAMGDEGLGLVLDGLKSESSDERFLAAAIAETLRDPRTIKPLEDAALKEDDFIVRRMAAHALALMGNPDTGDSLVKLIDKETRDSGVRVNAWYGLAKLKRPEAGPLFDKVLAQASGDIPPDVFVAIAMQVGDTGLNPSLRRAYDDERVSIATRASILRTLGNDPNRGFDDFLHGIVDNQGLDQRLRDAAAEALRR